MRPLELTLDSFRSHRQRVTFDWRDRKLVGVVGPIGSGKSTILDAIVFALYGKTPVFERDTKSLIHQLCGECHVELLFDVDGEVWRAVRALRRRGQSGHSLDHLASQDPGSEPVEPTITGETPVTRRIEQLLGLDFKGFCRSVLLAQNQFSRFLKATPGDRNDVLKGVFGLDRIDAARVRAKLRLERVQAELEGFAEKRDEIDEAKAALPGAVEKEQKTATRRRDFEKAVPKVETCMREREEAQREEIGASDRVAALSIVRKVLPRESDIDQAAAEAEESAKALKANRAHLEKTGKLRSEAQAALEDTKKRTGNRQELARTRAQIAKQEERAAAVRRERERLIEAEKRVQQTKSRLELVKAQLQHAKEVALAADKDFEDGRKEANRLESDLERARHAEYALELRGGLHQGELCPVCQQMIHELPRAAERSRDLEVAQRANAQARKLQDDRQRGKEAAGRQVASAESAVRETEASVVQSEDDRQKAASLLESQQAEVTNAQQKLETLLGSTDLSTALDQREQELDSAEGAVFELQEREREAQATVDEASQSASLIKDRLASFASTLTGAWGQLGETRQVAATAKSLRGSLGQLSQELTKQQDEAKAAGKKAIANSERATTLFTVLLDSLGLTVDSDFQKERVRVAALHGGAKQTVKDLRAQLRQENKLAKRISEAEATRELAARLAKDLEPSRFLAFLLEGHRAELAELGSEHFEQLTAGDYRFTADDQFDVVDLNAAGEERSADSLSGGETFLASLALALGLAEMVARGGGRLDAFFLDEGFGSLDPEHLDLAMNGIGKLVADSDRRLVVLVSHVPEMSDAIEDLIRLDKDEATGDSRLISGAARES